MNKFATPVTIAVLAVIGLVGGFFTREYIEHSANATPTQQLSAAVNSIVNATSFGYDGDVLVKEILPATSTQPAAAPFDIAFSGSVDAKELATPKATFNVSFTLPAGTGLDSLVQSGDVSVESRFLQSALYLKIDKMPNLFVDLQPILNTWVSFDLSQTPYYNQAAVADPTTVAKIKAFKNDLDNAHLLDIGQTFPTETVGGISTNHYGLAINKVNLVAFVPRYAQFIHDLAPTSTEAMAMTQTEITDLQKKIQDLPQDQFPTADIWLSRSTFEMKRIAVNASVNPQSTAPGASIVFTLNYSNLNQPVAITVPAPVITYQDAIAKVMGPAPTSTKILK